MPIKLAHLLFLFFSVSALCERRPQAASLTPSHPALDAYLAEKQEEVRAKRTSPQVENPAPAQVLRITDNEVAENQAEFFSDSALHALEQSGVDAKAFRQKLERGDIEGAKDVLNRVGQEKTLEEAEEEVKELVKRRVRLERMKKSLQRGEGAPVLSEEDGTSSSDDSSPSDSGSSDEGADGGGGADERKIRLIRRSQASNVVPGYQNGEDRVAPTGKENPLMSEEVRAAATHAAPTEEIYDLVRLKMKGVRRLVPGMNIFRFAHHRYGEWEYKEGVNVVKPRGSSRILSKIE